MDLSPLIFVALAVAWAVYLVPKALKHHDEVVRSRSVEKFSHTMRVLARREPVNGRNARLVVSPSRTSVRPPVETKARTTPAAPATVAVAPPVRAVTRASARRAARRRRNVLTLVLLTNAVVVGLAVAGTVAWPWVAVPVGMLLTWLLACRLSVRAERAARRAQRAAIEVGVPPELDDTELTGEIPPVPAAPAVPAPAPAPDAVPTTSPAAEAPAVLSGEIPIVTATAAGWDMVPTTLPTYVSKPAAHRRTVSTIDLDSTGVWSSGRHDGDSALAREAEQAEQAERTAREDAAERRASGA